MPGQGPSRLDQEASTAGGGLVVQDLAEGDPGAVIDGRVDIVVADAWSALGGGPAVGAVAAAVGMRPSVLTSRWTSSPGRSRWERTTAPLVGSVSASRLIWWRRSTPSTVERAMPQW
jgi:hypothetical protein